MKVTEIIVTAGRTFNHPYEQYSNLRPEVRLTATLEDGEDASAATRALQAQAEHLVEDHKNALLASLREIADLREAEQTVAQLDHKLADITTRVQAARSRLAERRGNGAGGGLTALMAGTDPAPAPYAPDDDNQSF